jgi:hypothetical protein
MRRFAALAILASLLVSGGCATYKQDLERAERHYAENQFEQALALFRVLEDDMDSLTPADQARYSYLRGMNDFRLSALATAGSGVADPKKLFRMNARHWLGVAAATEKSTPGGLSDVEKQRLEETLNDLNRDVYGGADALPEGSATPAGSAAPAASGTPVAGPPAASAAPAAPGSAAPGQPPAGTAPTPPK